MIVTQKYLCFGKSVVLEWEYHKQFRAKLQAANDVGARALRRQRSDFHWKLEHILPRMCSRMGGA